MDYMKHEQQCNNCQHLINGVCELAVHVGQIHELWPIDGCDDEDICEEFLQREK